MDRWCQATRVCDICSIESGNSNKKLMGQFKSASWKSQWLSFINKIWWSTVPNTLDESNIPIANCHWTRHGFCTMCCRSAFSWWRSVWTAWSSVRRDSPVGWSRGGGSSTRPPLGCPSMTTSTRCRPGEPHGSACREACRRDIWFSRLFTASRRSWCIAGLIGSKTGTEVVC